MSQAPQTIRLWGFFVRFMGLILMLALQVMRPAQAADISAWETSTAFTRERLHAMDAAINLRADPVQAYEKYMATFSPAVRVHGLLPGALEGVSGPGHKP